MKARRNRRNLKAVVGCFPVCPRVWLGRSCLCAPKCNCGRGPHDSYHDPSMRRALGEEVHEYTPNPGVLGTGHLVAGTEEPVVVCQKSKGE